MDRKVITDKLDRVYTKLCEAGLDDEAEDILINNGASEDDSDPEEGFMATMTDKDIMHAIKEMANVYRTVNPETVNDMIHALNSGTQEVSRDYTDGFIDACRMIRDEYHIDFDGLDE